MSVDRKVLKYEHMLKLIKVIQIFSFITLLYGVPVPDVTRRVCIFITYASRTYLIK